MLILDDREDRTLSRYLASHGVPWEVHRLEFGDAAFEGHGPDNLPVMVGFERKTLPDVVKSMTDRRLSGHQLRGMWQSYDYCHLVVEDNYRPGEDGSIQIYRGTGWTPLYVGSRGVTFRQLDSYLCSLEVCGNLIVLRSGSTRETAAIYAARYYWWQKDWDDHHAHDQIYSPGPEVTQHRGKAIVLTKAPGIVEKIAAQLPGIDRKAWDVGRKFPTPADMILATEAEWMEIPGIGKGIAQQVVRLLHRTAKAGK